MWLCACYGCKEGINAVPAVCLLLHLPSGLPGECGETMGMGKWEHGKFPVIVATCMTSMPPLKAHRDTISYKKSRKTGASRQVGEGGRP
jgi:hypothetical protein